MRTTNALFSGANRGMKKADQITKKLHYQEGLLKLLVVSFLCFFAFTIYVISVHRFAVNSPYFDDFFWSFGFINDFLEADSFIEQLKLIYQQFNQHRIIYSKLVMVSLLKLTGEINFRTYVWVGNISLFLLAGLLNYYCISRKMDIFILVPVNFLLFNFSFFHNSILSYGLPNMAVIFFSFLAFYLADKNHFTPAILVGIAATFSNGNGLLVLPILSFLYLLRGYLKKFLIVLGVSLITIFAYFQNYEFDTGELTLDLSTISFGIDFLGGFYEAESHMIRWWLTVLLIAMNVSLWLRVVVKNVKYSDFLLGSFLFVCGTASKVALVRAIHNFSIPSWYNQYSLLFFVITLLFLYENFSQTSPKFKIALLLLFALIGVKNLYKSYTRNIPRASHVSSGLKADLMNYQKNNKWSLMDSQIGWSNYHRFNEITHDFVDHGIFNLASHQISEWDTVKVNSMFTVDSVSHDYIEIFIQEEILPSNSDTEYFASMINTKTLESYFIGVLYNIDHRFFINPATQEVVPTMFISADKYFQEAVSAGFYRLALHEVSEVNQKVYLSDQNIYIDNW
ncbi:hypothetical protein [Jiulongibacter sediminis]|nr:hypothetical protein [Jiulongibacter sediminis]